MYVCTHVHIFNPDEEKEQISTYVPSLPQRGQFTEGEMEKEAEVKIQTDGEREEKRRMNMTWRKNRKTDKEGGKEKSTGKYTRKHIPSPCTSEKDL